MAINLKRAAVSGALCALLLTPAPAAARVTVSVEFAYGGVAACGIGLYLYFGASWEVPFAARARQGALLELNAGRARWGVPLPALQLGSDPSGERAHEEIHLDLVRWRF